MNVEFNKIKEFLENEYHVNVSNYLLEEETEWEKLANNFREKFLLGGMKNHWFKIPLGSFSLDRKKELMDKIAIRKIYLVKIIKEDDLVNVFCSLPDHSDDLRNCLIFRLKNDELKLVSIENVCEDCFGTGYVEVETIRCGRCSGLGFSYSLYSNLINWKTRFMRPMQLAESKICSLPKSDLQKELLAMQITE